MPRSFARPVGFAFAAVSPDGKYFFGVGGGEELHRLRINGTELAYVSRRTGTGEASAPVPSSSRNAASVVAWSIAWLNVAAET